MTTLNDQLKNAQPGQWLALKGEDSPRQVLSVISLLELEERGKGNWIETGNRFVAIQIGGQKLVLDNFPLRNNGPRGTIVLTRFSEAQSMTEFIAPFAKTYGISGQQARVEVKVNEKTYVLVDLGMHQADESRGETFIRSGRCRHVAGKTESGEYFVHIDLIKGEGEDSTWITGRASERVSEIVTSIE